MHGMFFAKNVGAEKTPVTKRVIDFGSKALCPQKNANQPSITALAVSGREATDRKKEIQQNPSKMFSQMIAQKKLTKKLI